MNRFSKRHGHSIAEKPITIREDAPSGLRDFVIQIVYGLKKYEPSFLRDVICKVLRVSPDRNNWSEYPNIAVEVETLIHGCEWYYVYDIIEAFWDSIGQEFREEFTNELNDYFKFGGIGWKIDFGLIETRGDEVFENSISTVTTVLATAKLQTAQTEIKEAINDLSRRPHPDISGAIQHSLACLECVCRETTGDKKATLGELIKKFPGIVPRPLDTAIEKIWGFTSEQGRHLSEGKVPDYLEAELVVELTATLASFLGKKLGGTAEKVAEEKNELPF
jgi:hypothetical protein